MGKETLCENCLDVSSLDEIFTDGVCSDCYSEIKFQFDHFDN